MGRFDGKVVLITGASSGIGEAMARRFSAEGAAVVLAARRVDRLEALAEELRQGGRRALAVACDVTRDGDPERAVAAAREAFGPVDVAVANAGFGVVGRFDRLVLDDFRRQFETNVFGVLRTAWAVLDDLKRTRGTLVLIGSVAGYVGTPATSPYSMSKAAIRAFAQSIGPELHRDGVSVVLICPGFVESEIRKVDNRGVLHPEARDNIPAWLRMPAQTAARDIVRAVASRRREAIITGHGKAIVAAERLAPGLVAWAIRRSGPKRREAPAGAAGQPRGEEGR